MKNAWYAVGLGSEVPNLISGSLYICSSSNYTYSLPTEFTGETVTWNTSSNLQITSGQGTRSITVQRINNGAGSISAVYNHGSGNITCQLNLWVGPPLLDYISGPSYGQVNNGYTFYAYPTFQPYSGAEYSWYLSPLNGNELYPYSTFANIYFYYSGDYQVAAEATNLCGSSGWATSYIYIEGGGYYLISPNPASSEVTINTKQDESFQSSKLLGDNLVYTVSIFNAHGVLQKQGKYTGDSFTIAVGNLINGNYFIQIDNGKTKSTNQLIIKH